MRHRLIAAAVAAALLAAACGDADETAGTTVFDQGTYPAATTTYAAFAEEPPLGAGGTDNPNDEPYDLTFFENYGVNPRIDTIDDAFSTFAVDVDTGSYTIGRRWIRDGNLPDDDSVRVEEYVNFFDMGYLPPVDGPFSITVDGGPVPYVENERYQWIRIGLQSYVVPDEERPPANLTFVIDVSGSMDREDRLEAVKDALEMLVDELKPSDQVGIVVYGDTGQVILEPTAVESRDQVIAAIRSLQPGGSTNAEEGLALAYGMAEAAYAEGAINRVILCSDGVANVGNTGPESILATIREEAGAGIQLVTVGFGMGNYNDVLMEQLADDGDGFYAYVDDLREAERLFVHDLTGTLLTVAKDARVQVEFDPDGVAAWRLIGFENRAIDDEQFRDDTVDAGEIGSGHSVTALYEIRLADGVADDAVLGTVRLRWLDPESGEAVEMEQEFTAADLSASYEETPEHFQLAATVAAYAEVLRDSYWAQSLDLDTVAAEARRVAALLAGDDDVAEFADLAERAARLAG
jgi:Ca-activated chloride channel family protein